MNKLVRVAFGLFCAASTAALGEAKPIVVGQSAAFTGASGQFGRQMWLGAQTYFDDINRQGGIHGRKIVVLAADDRYDAEQAKKNTTELLKTPDLVALFGYVGTPTTLAALPELQKFRAGGSPLVLFADRSGAKQLRTPPLDAMVYNIRPSYAEETEVLVNALTTKGAKRVGLFLQDDSYGQSGKDGVVDALKKRGLTVAAETLYPRGTKFSDSTTAQAAQLVAQKVDAVIAVASYEAAAAFIRDMRDANFAGPIANISFVGSGDLLRLLVAAGDKTKHDYTANLINSQVVPPVSEKHMPLVAEYINLTEAHPPVVPEAIAGHETIRKLSFTGLEGFLNAKALVHILRQTKEPITAASFAAAADSADAVDLGLGETFKFSKAGHQAFHKVYLTKVEHGAYVLAN